MTQERAYTPTTRGLVDSEIGTPLREFSGILDAIYPEERKFGDVNVMNFRDVEVKESVEPYNFPTATIAIKVSNLKGSGWGVFGESLNLLIPEDEDISDCVGKRLNLKMEVGHVYGKTKEGIDMVGNPWTVTEVEGEAAPAAGGKGKSSATDKAKTLIIGKTRAEFNKDAFADSAIRKDAALTRAITDKSFINAMIELGEVVEDENGVFQLPAAEVDPRNEE